MNLTQLIQDYWWIPLPFLGMLLGIYSLWAHYNHKRQTLNMIKTYLEKGIEPPQALYDHLKSDEERDYDMSLTGQPKHHALGHIGVFAALSGAFGYFGYARNHEMFIALAIGFGIAAAGSLLAYLLIRPKKD